MSNKQKQRRVKVEKNLDRKRDRRQRKQFMRQEIEWAHTEEKMKAETASLTREQEVFRELDARLQKALEVNTVVIETSQEASDELKQKMVRQVPGVLFHWIALGEYMMAFEVDGECWIYHANDPVRCDMKLDEDSEKEALADGALTLA